jgi:hypothetical protein
MAKETGSAGDSYGGFHIKMNTKATVDSIRKRG